MTPEAHKYAAAARSFCFVTTENGEQQDVYNLTTIRGVLRSLWLDEVIDDSSSTRVEFPKGADNQTRDILKRCMATCGKAAGARAKRKSRARKEASAQEVRGYYKQFAAAKHLEWKSWIDNEIFDLVDCDLQGRKINFRKSKTLVGRRRDRRSRTLPLTCPNVNDNKNQKKKKNKKKNRQSTNKKEKPSKEK